MNSARSAYQTPVFLLANAGAPALDYHLFKSGTSGSNRDPPAPKAGVLPSAPLPELLCQWTCRELNPGALIASQSADPSASPLVISVTRVGFEPDLAGLKDQQPHQKSNEPFWFCRRAPLAPVVLKVFLQATHSVDWEVLEPSSPALQASAIPSQLPVHLHVKRWK